MRFEVRALRPEGGVITEAIDATDADTATRLASARGLAVLSARPQRLRLLPDAVRARRGRFDVAAFSQELVALLGAGLSMPETLDVMIEKDTRTERRRVVQSVRERLYEGLSFSQSVAALGDVFPPLYVATVRAAERSGDLGEALARFIDYEARLEAVRRRVVAASIYPAALLVIGALVAVFLLAWVVPRFAAIYSESGRELPWLSRLLVEWGALINAHGALLGVAALVSAFLLALSARRAAAAAVALAGRIPALRDRLLVYHLARLYRTLGMLLRGGTPLVSALQMVPGLLPPLLRRGLAAATQRVREGAAVSDALHAVGLTTPVALRMLRVGENSGELAQMMDRIAAYHDDELSRWVDWFTRLFEPVLMALIGIVIGGIVILMYLPIFDLAGSLQ